VAAFLNSPSGQASITIDILRQKGIERLMSIADGTAPDLPELSGETETAPAGEVEPAAAIESAADVEAESMPAEQASS
jgi:hypothetical protein